MLETIPDETTNSLSWYFDMLSSDCILMNTMVWYGIAHGFLVNKAFHPIQGTKCVRNITIMMKFRYQDIRYQNIYKKAVEKQ